VINGSLVDYAGKWFDTPHTMEYEIIAETGSVVLTIQEPTDGSPDANKPVVGDANYDAGSIS
jgi:hypothetical protein